MIDYGGSNIRLVQKAFEFGSTNNLSLVHQNRATGAWEAPLRYRRRASQPRR